MSKKTTERIKVGWKITQQNPDKLQNVKWLFPGRLHFQKPSIRFTSLSQNQTSDSQFIILTDVKRNQP